MSLRAEFQAVVLAAGRGSRMSEITAKKPKCLLPVGSKPLVWYTLNKLQRIGFTDVIMIVLENEKNEIQNVLDKAEIGLKIDYCCIPEHNEDCGTAESLRSISDKLTSDVLVVSCDFITDVDFREAIELFRMHDASVTTLFLHSHMTQPIVVPGPKSKHKQERDLIGMDAQSNRLIFLASASDFESELTLPTSLLRKHTNIKMYSRLVDSHIYVIKNWVIKYLKSEDSFSSIKGDLLPHVIKKQLSKPPKSMETTNSILNKDITDDIFAFSKEEELTSDIRNSSSYNDHFGDLKSTYHNDAIRCYAYLAPKTNFGIRVNTLTAYWYINNKINDSWEEIAVGNKLVLQHPKATINSNQVDNKCVIWDGAKLNEKTSFKNSIIGLNTEVNSFSRVFNSVVMNNVTIKEKVVLENCIVCDNVTIESGCQLKGCIVGSHHTVEKDSEHASEVLTDSDRLMEF